MNITGSGFDINITPSGDSLWSYSLRDGSEFAVSAPVFEVDGERLAPVFKSGAEAVSTRTLRSGVTEHVYRVKYERPDDVALELTFRAAPGNPVVRFRYSLISGIDRRLTKQSGADSIEYLAINGDKSRKYTEVRFSEFNEMTHTFRVSEYEVAQRQFDNGFRLIGPMVVSEGANDSFLIAYEHGAEAPDCFLSYATSPERAITLSAVKGNYYHNQIVNESNPYTTVWFQFAAVPGNVSDLAAKYREFQLKYATENLESRKPYIFYNTWAGQERRKFWEKGQYLDNINLERMLAEIDVAHRMGIDVFVLDTGWYEKTGDWTVDLSRLPDGLKDVKARLDSYGMKLGLWFEPASAAVSSEAFAANRDNRISDRTRRVWDTEESYHMCLVSGYWETVADKLIEAYNKYGVTYFKWDGIGQYNCNSPLHHHGNEGNEPGERFECAAFSIGLYMSKIVDKLCAECPGAIVDFDVTEGRRYFGLGFLSSGKYFLVNNGPYYHNYNIPIDPEVTYCNIFAYPGLARTWICRSPLGYDKWIPSVLFLTHYFPDDPEYSQVANVASLILGQNGIWGDLLRVSEQGVDLIGDILRRYKKVRDAVTESSVIMTGSLGSSPEIYEKVSKATGKGAVVVFSNNAYKCRYVTSNKVVKEFWATEGAEVEFDGEGRASITCSFSGQGAKIVLFGV